MGPQIRDVPAKVATLQKQASKLENDLVQAHAYWKRQWGQLEEQIRMQEASNPMNIKALVTEAINNEEKRVQAKWEKQMDTKVSQMMEESSAKLEQMMGHLTDDMAGTVKQYKDEIKGYMEEVAKVYQDDLVACCKQQQHKLRKQNQDSIKSQDDKVNEQPCPENLQVPTQVDIPTTASQMEMSRRSIDPPKHNVPIPRRSALPTIDLTNVENIQQIDHTPELQTTPQPDRWHQYGIQRPPESLQQKEVQHNQGLSMSQLREAYPHLIIEERTPARKAPPQQEWQPPIRNPYAVHQTVPHGRSPREQQKGYNLQDEFDDKFETAFNHDAKYLMGLDGTESITIEDLEEIGFADPVKAYRAFHTEHQTLMANWHTTTSRGKIVGPNQKQLLQDISLFNPLASTRQADVIDFVAQFHDLIDSYNIAVMPFSMIEVKFGIVGLCLPGVGEMKYDQMGQALAKILYGHLIPHNIDKVGKLDQLLLNAKNRVQANGYEMLYIPFKPHMVEIKWPTFGGCRNIFDYAGQFSVIMQLYEKKGDRIEPRKAALKILEAVKREGGVTYKAAALLLKTAIMERPPEYPLPPRFQIGNMATFIADSNAEASDDDFDTSARGEVRVIRNKEYTTCRTNATSSTPTASPRDFRLIKEAQVEDTAATQTTSLSTITTALNRYMQGYTPHRQRINQAVTGAQNQAVKYRRPMPEPMKGRNNPRRRRAYDPFTKCHACGRTGDPAVQCDTLAMAILIWKYMDESGNADAMKQAAENWFCRNEEALKCPQNVEASSAKPLQVLHTYLDRYLKDIDEVDEQMDWEYFRQDEDTLMPQQE
jgi:hypothetical protein